MAGSGEWHARAKGEISGVMEGKYLRLLCIFN
jgi:hypothetical protein